MQKCHIQLVDVVERDSAGTPKRTCLRGIRSGLQDLSGSGHQIEHANEVSLRGCRIARVQNTRSNVPTVYHYGAAGSHGFGTPDRTYREMREITVIDKGPTAICEYWGKSNHNICLQSAT